MNRIPIDEDGRAQLRVLREKSKLTIHQLAEAVGIAPSTVSKCETGYAKSLPEFVLGRWADALGVVVSYSPSELTFKTKRSRR